MICSDGAPDQFNKNLACSSFLRVMSEHDYDFKGHENDEALHRIIEGQSLAIQNHTNQSIQGIDSMLCVGRFSEGNDLVSVPHHAVSVDHIDSHMWEKHQPSSDALGSMVPSSFNNIETAENDNDSGRFESVDAVEETDMDQLKAVILSHPLYQKLLEAHFSCLKVNSSVELTIGILLDPDLDRCYDGIAMQVSDSRPYSMCKRHAL